MPTNKSHWYDGVFYDTFIAPNQDRMFSVIFGLVKQAGLHIVKEIKNQPTSAQIVRIAR